MNVTRYNPKDCTITVDGVFITQLGEDMVSFSKEEAYFETKVGALGDVVKSEINNTIHTLTLTIQATSPQKAFLMSKFGSTQNFPIWVTNKALGVRFGGTMASVQEQPEISLGSEAEDMEFTFIVFDGVLETA
jgi:hypothetical protein